MQSIRLPSNDPNSNPHFQWAHSPLLSFALLTLDSSAMHSSSLHSSTLHPSTLHSSPLNSSSFNLLCTVSSSFCAHILCSPLLSFNLLSSTSALLSPVLAPILSCPVSSFCLSPLVLPPSILSSPALFYHLISIIHWPLQWPGTLFAIFLQWMAECLPTQSGSCKAPTVVVSVLYWSLSCSGLCPAVVSVL